MSRIKKEEDVDDAGTGRGWSKDPAVPDGEEVLEEDVVSDEWT